MLICRDLPSLRAATAALRAGGKRLALVPTMGALHDGHLSLVRAAKEGADRVVVTIFVNPRQFNNPEDFARYPRTEQADAAILAPYGVDALFVPSGDEVYPPGHATTVSVAGVSGVEVTGAGGGGERNGKNPQEGFFRFLPARKPRRIFSARALRG